MIAESIKQLAERYAGEQAEEVVELASSGSNRRYFRVFFSSKSYIGASGTSVDENNAFIYLANHFHSKGLPVPQVLAVSDDQRFYLQEDLGDTILFDVIEKGRKSSVFSAKEIDLLSQTMYLLPEIQYVGGKELDYSHCYPQPVFNKRSVLWDLNYFKYCFLKPAGLDFQENLLEDDFMKMADVLLQSESNTFMYRDFQSRNVMVKEGKPYFIDFQGGRKGPIYYDVASFLWQAKAAYPRDLRKQLLDVYIQSLSRFTTVDKEQFLAQLKHFVLFRMMQVLGAYGFRGYFEKKPHFMQSVPFAIKNLHELLVNEFKEYPYLYKVLLELTELKQFSDDIENQSLEIKVASFAYKKGIPNDPSGNGGGFVFDCRAIDNPGKYERYRHFTGLDEPVIQFLKEGGEIDVFLDNAYQLVEPSVKRYIDRGFTNLMVAFGCTGGQHRSVYCAQRMAELLHKNFGVKVELTHREQNIEQLFRAR